MEATTNRTSILKFHTIACHLYNISHVVNRQYPNFRSPKVTEETDNDCDMPEVTKQDDDTDIESFEREERRMEEEVEKVDTYPFPFLCLYFTLCFSCSVQTGNWWESLPLR